MCYYLLGIRVPLHTISQREGKGDMDKNFKVGIVDYAIYTPGETITAEELSPKVHIPADVLRNKMGINKIHVGTREDQPGNMALKCCQNLLEKTKFDPLEIDDPNGTLDEDGNVKQVKINQGWAQDMEDIVESLTGVEGGKTTMALQTLDTKLTKSYEELEYMGTRLQAKEAALMQRYQKMELSLAKMQADMNSVSSIASNWSQNWGQTYMNNYGYY